jgi:hypothetical protein
MGMHVGGWFEKMDELTCVDIGVKSECERSLRCTRSESNSCLGVYDGAHFYSSKQINLYKASERYLYHTNFPLLPIVPCILNRTT